MYAHRADFPQHEAARTALKGLVEGSKAWALPVFVLAEFLRVATHPRILTPPTDEATAVDALESVIRSPAVRVLSPGPAFWGILKELVIEARARGNLVHDAQIAALCLEHGATTILTEDRDFHRFTDLEVRRLEPS